MSSNKCHICQHGVDGFGHQLYGLFSTLILHTIKNYYFDGEAYCTKPFRFDHINIQEQEPVKQYLLEAISQFTKGHNQKQIQYTNHIHSHEIYKIPIDFDSNTIYTIDNAYYFDRIQLTDTEKIKHQQNIILFKKYFINKYLPANRLHKKNIVVHIRLGDALQYNEWNKNIQSFNTMIQTLLHTLHEKYPDYTIYIHSNGTIDFLDDIEYVFYDKKTSVLHMLSDFIYSNIFVCGSSAFSKISTFLGNQSLIIIPDNTKQSMPSKCIQISDYLDSN